MCTVGVYKCVCVSPMCVLSVAISDSVSCVVCGTEALFTVHNARVYTFIVFCCNMCTCVCCEL